MSKPHSEQPRPPTDEGAYLEEIVDSIHSGVLVFDRDGVVEYATPAAIPDDEVRAWSRGRTLEEVGERMGREREYSRLRTEALARALDEKEPIEYEEETETGGLQPVLRRVVPMLDERGEVSRLITYRADIRARKEMEVRLREATRFLESLIASSPGVIFRGDGNTFKTTYISPNAEAVLGFPMERFFSDPPLWVTQTHPDDQERVANSLMEAMQSGADQLSYGYRFLRGDGEYRHLMASVRFERDDVGNVEVLGFTLDITALKEAEEALRAAKDEAEDAREIAEAANHAKSEFLSRMSHELRTPMNSILGFAQLLARRNPSPEQSGSLDHILRAGRHLLNLINEVLDIARIEANQQALSVEPVEVGQVVEEALNLIHPLAAQYGCQVLGLEADDQVFVSADRQRLVQVVLNLLSNGIKYNRSGGRVWVTLEPTGRDGKEDRVSIGIHDTGPGIPAERFDELFVPFSRLGAEEGEVEGTGLGLTLSQRLIEAMQGTLAVESTVGEGTTFWIELPRRSGPSTRSVDGRSPPREQHAGIDSELRGMILYVEDNLANLNLVETILAPLSEVGVVPALQGRVGIDLAVEHQPDLILLDLHLPDIPGAEVLRRLKADESTRHIPVVVVSADATDRRVHDLLSAGADAYLTKPLDVDQFLDAVQGLLVKSATQRGVAPG